MRKTSMRAFLAICLCLAFVLPSTAGAKAGQDKTGILLVAFGTTVPRAEAAYAFLEKKVKQAFPGTEVRWAYTSDMVRHSLEKKRGSAPGTPAMALAAMLDQGFTRVVVQSLHVIPGQEFNELMDTVNAFRGMRGGFKSLDVGLPLLSGTGDLREAAKAVLASVPGERKKDEAVVFMGHGTHHAAGVYYPAMQYALWRLDPNAFMGTVEGWPALDDVRAELASRKLKKAYLVPFMAVAGDHAVNDMAGPEDDSWKSVLTKAGVACVPVVKGMGENEALAELWVEHLKRAMRGNQGGHGHD